MAGVKEWGLQRSWRWWSVRRQEAEIWFQIYIPPHSQSLMETLKPLLVPRVPVSLFVNWFRWWLCKLCILYYWEVDGLILRVFCSSNPNSALAVKHQTSLRFMCQTVTWHMNWVQTLNSYSYVCLRCSLNKNKVSGPVSFHSQVCLLTWQSCGNREGKPSSQPRSWADPESP